MQTEISKPQTSINIQRKRKTMKRHAVANMADLESLAEDAKALLTATGHVAEEKVVEARRRLAAALDKGRESWERVQERAVASAKATDEAIHEHPYHTAGIAFGVGALIGYLMARR
jgi:ElaB/YqjD/DUF883 family membrane-anchored ribosome-binding protein